MLVWTRITEGEYLFAPLVLQDQQASGRNQLAHLVQHAMRSSRTGHPGHHYVALMTALDAYADQLAARIDAGWDGGGGSDQARALVTVIPGK